ncbi:MAG: bacillithiol biosynthesis cysteine-adding enzyme BshC [Bacteroidetes bacterium]|nr:bacillithiol biosynthesis cysteine-adding enzyme BshC [Bacteroidota bacterium]HET6243365.1 bacillithiol biosynthesis cysteine-adding enzyme BshC [Bacteroidia bacterium]
MVAKTTKIDFEKTGFFSKIIVDYLNKDEKLEPFFNFYPEPSSFEKALKKKKYNFDRTILADVITKQNVNAEINISQSSLKNIDLLKSSNTYTITTGHQLCLFTGPLYFIYKIITCINYAGELKERFPAYDFVPVFWLASEDHDFEEVNHINIFNKKIVWNPEQAVKGAVGRINTSSLGNEINELKQIMGEGENALKLNDLFDKAFLKHNNLSDALRYLVNELFSKWGIVIIDGSDKKLKEAFKPIIKDDILNNTAFGLINNTIKELSNAGYRKVQMHPREINFFYLKNNLRERIEKAEDGTYKVHDTELIFSESELINEIDNYPERFSPNVSLRPLFEEFVLPGIAYVGGGGELAYWLELKSVFDYYKTDFPALILRNSALWIDANSADRLKKLNLTAKDLFENSVTLINKLVAEQSDFELSLEDEMNELKTIYNRISTKALSIDVTLKASVEADLQKNLQSLKHLENKLLKAEKQKQEITVSQVTKLKEKLFPGNGLQERHENFIPYYLKHGDNYLDILKEQFKPFSESFLIIEENIYQRQEKQS